MDRPGAVETSNTTWNGRVVAVRDGTASVRIDRDGCAACPSAGFCGSIGGDEPPIEALNGPGAVPGDRVAVDVRPSARVIAGILVFLVPVVASIGGALAGASLGPRLSGIEADVGAAAGFLGGLIVAFAGLALARRRVEASPRFVPVVVRILPAQDAADAGPACAGRGPVEGPEPARSIGS